jgi:translation initiation factor IF-2
LAKSTGKIRIHNLSKELGVDSKEIVAKCQAEGVPNIDNHMSVVSVGLAATIREWFSESSPSTSVETAKPVDVAHVRSKAKRKSSKAATADHDDVVTDESSTATAVVEPPPRRTRPAAPPAPPTAQPPAPPPAPQSPTRVVDVSAPEAPPQPRFEPPPAPAEVVRPAARAKETPFKGTRSTRPDAPPTEPTSSKPAKPVMNVPERPKDIKPVGPMLKKPTETILAGPRVIRVEAADPVAPPRRRSDEPGTRPGPRGGRGVGSAPGAPPEVPGGPSRTGRGGQPASRRNKRRSASAHEEGERSNRFAPAEGEVSVWRPQDLLERENRLTRAGGFFRQHRRDNLKRSSGGGQRASTPAETGGKLRITAPISVKDLSAATGIKAADILKKLLLSGKPASINASLDAATAVEVMVEYEINLEIVEAKSAEEQIAEQSRQRTMTDVRPRSPVVTILGHVDHGKTSLLDKIRNANVAAGEAGGITQKTSAFRVPVHAGDKTRTITFIDTPGHEAFTAMRARGAKVTDVVVLVVAADDGVMPQTVESINHAKAAGVPIVVALNKIDKPEATESNIQRILGQLAEHELNPVEWGGTTEVMRTSATQGVGVQELLEILDFQADLLELKADYGGLAEGTVLEARMEEGRGAVASALVQQGILRKGDYLFVGRAFGRVRDIVDDRGQRLDEAEPGMPVAFSGIDVIPDAGDKFYAVESLREAEEAANDRREEERQRQLVRERVTLDNIFKKLAESGRKELPLIVKADVQGSLDAIVPTLEKISTDKVTISIKHTAVGGINESDVLLAETTGSIIIGFNVTAPSKARKEAEARGVDIRLYEVIYDITDDVTKAAEGLLEPERKLEVIGHAEVRAVFKISRVGMIAGCYVTDGVIERNAQIRVTRGGIVVEKDRRLEQLKRFKDDAKEVKAGMECGMKIDGYDDIKEGDVLECYKTITVRRTL